MDIKEQPESFYTISYVREENTPAEAIGGVRERSFAAEDALRLCIALDLHWAPVCSSSVRGERHHVSLQLLHHIHAAFLGYAVQTQYGLLLQFVVLYVQSILVFECFKSLRSCSGNTSIPSRAPRVEHSRNRAADKLDKLRGWWVWKPVIAQCCTAHRYMTNKKLYNTMYWKIIKANQSHLMETLATTSQTKLLWHVAQVICMQPPRSRMNVLPHPPLGHSGIWWALSVHLLVWEVEQPRKVSSKLT